MQVIVTAEVLLILVIVLGIIISDIFLYLGKNPDGTLPRGLTGDTYSELSRYWGRFTPLMPWLWGLVAGRFFHWGGEPVIEPPWALIVLLAISAVVVALLTIFSRVLWRPFASRFGMTLAFFVAYLLGAWFWPVNVIGIDFR